MMNGQYQVLVLTATRTQNDIAIERPEAHNPQQIRFTVAHFVITYLECANAHVINVA